MLHSRMGLVLLLALSGVACSDGPLGVQSDALEIEARLMSSAVSLASASDSVVVVVRVRNPWPWRATVQLRGFRPSSHIWWAVAIDPGPITLLNGFGELSLEPHQAVEHRIALHSDRFAQLGPGVYSIEAGLGYDLVPAGQLVVSP